MMLYISEVGMDNGPFQYVMGSARAADPMDLLIRKRGDKLKFSHRQIMALPKEFRRKSHFGFDLLDDMLETDRTPERKNLLLFGRRSRSFRRQRDSSWRHREGRAPRDSQPAARLKRPRSPRSA